MMNLVIHSSPATVFDHETKAKGRGSREELENNTARIGFLKSCNHHRPYNKGSNYFPEAVAIV
jgi:hypothetical protein